MFKMCLYLIDFNILYLMCEILVAEQKKKLLGFSNIFVQDS